MNSYAIKIFGKKERVKSDDNNKNFTLFSHLLLSEANNEINTFSEKTYW